MMADAARFQLFWFWRSSATYRVRVALNLKRIAVTDIFVASIVAVMKVFEIGVADIPTVDRIIARCNDIRAFAEADPRKQEGAPAA